MKSVILSLIVISIVSCVSVKTQNQYLIKEHSVSDLNKDVDNVHRQLVKHHPKIYQYISKTNLDHKFDSLKQTVIKPINSQEFFEKIAPVIASIRQGHILVSPPFKRFSKAARKERVKQKFEFNNLDFEEFHNKVFVTHVIDEKDSLLVGAEVVMIENELAYDLVHKFKNYFASDGYNKTLQKRFVKNRFRSFYYVNRGVIDSLNVTFKQKDSTFLRTFKRVPKAKFETDITRIEKITNAKKITKAERKDNKLKQKEKLKLYDKYGYVKSRNEFTRNFKYIGKDSSVAYMKIRGFTTGDYKKFYKESFTKIDSLKTKNLIIDLRDNSGGRLSEIDDLYSYLTKQDYIMINPCEVNSRVPFLKMFMSNTSSVGTKVFIGAFSPFLLVHNLIKVKKENGKLFYKFKQSKVKEPNTLGYKGNIYVLINGNSFSASSIISTKLKATGRAMFVGEETGGAYNGTVAGLFKNYQLPTSKINVRIGLMQLEAPHKITPDGYGIIPDIKISPTLEDRLSGNDPELNWILNDISTKEPIKK
ncbi:MAG: peptidase S41 [Flavobacteriaceae bacterium]|nr:peptidase S41 [Flavobacteriaceae bacterium]